ncbi:hypothetical protein HZS_2674 [Henneguya salminicola]|nr:hypothetical protein HZS_2674 [Henneguya salminicola]
MYYRNQNNQEAIETVFNDTFYQSLLEPAYGHINFASEYFVTDHIIEQLEFEQREHFEIERVLLRCFVSNLLRNRLPPAVDIITKPVPTLTLNSPTTSIPTFAPDASSTANHTKTESI